MTRMQQVLFQLESDYYGNPYYITGHAIFNAIARHVDARTRRALQASHGILTPKEYGRYPEPHSESGYAGKLGGSLPEAESYDDLFVYRDPGQPWLFDERPRDLHNTHDVRTHGGRLTFAPRMHVGRRPEVRNHKRTVRWFIHCYLHADGTDADEEILPISDAVLDGLRFGGGRNYGLGEVSVADTQLIELDELDYERLQAANEYVLELVSPFVLASEYPEAASQSVPWWWDTESKSVPATSGGASDGLRRRTERLVGDEETYELATIDHGQRVGYAGDRPVQTARNGLRRVGTHSRFGFGELRVRPADDLGVPDDATETSGGVV
jgi:hypothetical protein